MQIKKGQAAKAVEVSNLSYGYNGTKVLDDISFSIDEGKYVGVIGPNGGGKTTLLKILLGLFKPQTGSVKIFGKKIQHLKEKYIIGYVPQRISQENLRFPVTVYEIVESGRIGRTGTFGFLKKEDREVIDNICEISGIAKFKHRLLHQLSGGERQKVYVARALAAEPNILILDEPFIGIDASAQEDFYAFLKKLNKEQHLTILFVSHDIDVISQEVQEILCLNKRLVCAGSTKKIKEENIIERLYGKRITHIHHDHV